MFTTDPNILVEYINMYYLELSNLFNNILKNEKSIEEKKIKIFKTLLTLIILNDK